MSPGSFDLSRATSDRRDFGRSRAFAYTFHVGHSRQQAEQEAKESVRGGGKKAQQSPEDLVKSESYRYSMEERSNGQRTAKLIIKGPWADTRPQALLNTYEGELLHSLSHNERRRVGISERTEQITLRPGCNCANRSDANITVKSVNDSRRDQTGTSHTPGATSGPRDYPGTAPG